MMRTSRAFVLLLCLLLGTSAFVPSTPSPRTPAILSPSPMTTKSTDKTSRNARSWRHRLIAILPSMLRPTENRTKRRALASLLVAASFAFSPPAGAYSRKNDIVTSVKQQQSLPGHIRQKAVQRKLSPSSKRGDSKLATIPVASKQDGFWTKRKVILVAAGGGTVLGLSLVPPVKDDDDDNDDNDLSEKTNYPALEVQVPPLPSSVTKEAFRELEELFGGGEMAKKTSETAEAEPSFVKSSVPSIEEDVRVISDPSAENVPTGIKAVKKVTPVIIEEEVVKPDVPPSNVPEANQDDDIAVAQKEETTQRTVLEEQLQQAFQDKKKDADETNGLKLDTAAGKSEENISNTDGPGDKNENLRNTADTAALSKKEEATRRAILEERLKEEAKKLEEKTRMRKAKEEEEEKEAKKSEEAMRLRKAKEEEAGRRALLEERLKEESTTAQSKKDEQIITEKSDDVDSLRTPNGLLRSDDEVPEADVTNSLSKEASPLDEPFVESSSEGVESITGRKMKYRRQPLSPDEEAALQKKYSSLPLKERAYRILVDLGMIDSSSE